MNIPKSFFKPGDQTFTIIVNNSVAEYEPPIIDSISLSTEWDGYKVSDILKLEHPDLSDPDRDIIKERIYNKQIEKLKKGDHYHLAPFDMEPDSDLYAITFWLREQGPNLLVTRYLNRFADYLILTLWNNRGADDDYYDYLPSITDVFRQLCSVFQAHSIWDIFLKRLIQSESSDDNDGRDVLDESLYTIKL